MFPLGAWRRRGGARDPRPAGSGEILGAPPWRPWRLAALMTGFAIVCALLFADFYRDARDLAVENLTHEQRIHARQASHAIQDFFAAWTRTLTALGSMEDVVEANAAGRRIMRLFYEGHKAQIRSITRMDERGIIVAAYPATEAEGLDITSQEHVAAILRGHRPVVSDVFRAVQGYDAVALHVPVYEGTKFRGSLAAVVDFQGLARDYFDVIRIGETGHAWVISRDGTLLYAPGRAPAGSSAFAAFEDFPSMTALLGEMTRGRSGVATYTMAFPGGKPGRFLAVYEPIPLANTFWSVTVASSEKELLAGLNSFRNHLLVVIGLLMIGGVLASIVVIRARLTVKEEEKRRQVEEAARSSERLRALTHDAIVDVLFYLAVEPGGRYRFLSANRAFMKATGLDESRVIGRPVEEVIPQSSLEFVREKYAEAVASGRAVTWYETTEYPAGTKYGEVSVVPVIDADGICRHLLGTVHDVTQQRLAEADLRRSEERYRQSAESLGRLSQAVDQAEEVVMMTDRDGVITYVNPAFEHVYGFPAAETLGRTPRILKSGQYGPADYERFWQTILAGKSIRDQVVNKTKDGRLVTVDRSVSPVMNDGGALVGFLSVQTDITNRKRLEEEREALGARMAELEKMEAIGTLAGGIAHDFNNILSVILSFAAVAERSRSEDPRFAEALATIRQAVRRGADLSKQVLTFARRAKSTAEAVDVNELLTEITRMARSTFPRTIAFEFDLAASLPLVIADGTQLHQAFLNLLINARDAMPAGGTLRVATRVVSTADAQRHFPDAREPAYVSVEVRDTGIGMTEDVRQRIFEPFFTTKEEGRGTGLGLAVTWGAVRAAGGYIAVETEKDRGTRFEVFLPLPASWNPATDEAGYPALALTGRETVLFVEDEPEVGPLMVENLRELGYAPLLARDGLEALEIIAGAGTRVDIVVSDDGLPGLAGRNLFFALRERGNLVPFVLASGFVDGDTLDSLRRAGVEHFLQKPYTVDALHGAIRSALRSAGNRPAAAGTASPAGR
ncbi:MAG TPA: PAS domain S-box protein [Thermoanaerobaculia bacterium]